MPDPITITFRFTRQDSVAFIRAQLLRRWLVRLVLALAVAWLALNVWMALTEGALSDQLLWPTALVVVVGILLPLFGPNLLVRFSQAEAEPPEVSWILSENGIHLDAPSAQQDYPWNHFDRVERDRAFYYFYAEGSIAAVLPRRALGAEQQGAVENLLEHKLEVTWK